MKPLRTANPVLCYQCRNPEGITVYADMNYKPHSNAPSAVLLKNKTSRANGQHMHQGKGRKKEDQHSFVWVRGLESCE